MSNISLPTEYWGESLWRVMYSFAYAYPNNPAPIERASAVNFFASLRYLMPCKECKVNYTALLRKYPLSRSVNSRNELLNWVEGISNGVNEHLGKEPFNSAKLYKELYSIKMDNSGAEQPAIRSINRSGAKREPCDCGPKV